MDALVIRQEAPGDFEAVERLTRDAFWNVNQPGCDEHYLAHILRGHADFIPALSLVALLDNHIVGSVMYTQCRLTALDGREKPVLTFGPLSVAPAYQRRGIGKALLSRSFELAVAMGHEAIVIFGDPANYVARGFQSCKRFDISLEGGVCPAAMLAKELRAGALAGGGWIYRPSDAYAYDAAAAAAFDARFPPKRKERKPGQEVFYILSHARVF